MFIGKTKAKNTGWLICYVVNPSCVLDFEDLTDRIIHNIGHCAIRCVERNRRVSDVRAIDRVASLIDAGKGRGVICGICVNY